MQGMTTVRAVLPLQEGFPKSEVHMFRKGNLIGNYYPISKDNCVWSFIVPASDNMNSDSSSADNNSKGSDAVGLSSSTAKANAPLSAYQVSVHSIDECKCACTCTGTVNMPIIAQGRVPALIIDRVKASLQFAGSTSTFA